jgi:hypothetical protein
MKGVMRMNRMDNRLRPVGMLAGQPPNGKTLAILCLKFVKDCETADFAVSALKNL